MSDHPNVKTVNEHDGRRSSTRTTMPWPRSSPTTSCSISAARIRWRATTRVSEGCSASSVRWFEATNGQIELDQQFCIGADGWAAEWEHATLRRNGNTLESRNAFVYRFDGDRIAEMWMFLGAPRDEAEAFFA